MSEITSSKLDVNGFTYLESTIISYETWGAMKSSR